MSTSRSYRADIDGLRALAIIPVIWFHVGLPGLPGGFTGVDTFFVISGFLITGIIHDELCEDRFSFRRFYERRFRRIAPALLAVLLTTAAVGWILLLPADLIALARSAIAALLMIPNVYFWGEAGYFALGESATPLLHTWSLGVEEQFYLLFPIILIFFNRLRITHIAVAILTIGSFVFCVIGTALFPAAAFYLLPTRAWELGLGAFLALSAIRVPPRMLHPISWLGLALVVGAAVAIQKSLLFPGYLALAPALGAALLIACGPMGIVNRALSMRPLVTIGRMSYSLYLWHWPLFVFLRYVEPDLSSGQKLAAIAIAFILAWLSYRYIERPTRSPQIPTKHLVIFGSSASALLLSATALMIKADGAPERFDQRTLALAAQRNDLAPLAHKCVNTPLAAVPQHCQIGSGRPGVLLIGDSHAAAQSSGIAAGFQMATQVYAMNSCPPAVGWTSPALSAKDRTVCERRNSDLLRAIAAPGNEVVVLAAYWPSHARNGGGKFWAGVQRFVDMSASTGRKVVIIAGTPEPGVDLPRASALSAHRGLPLPRLPCDQNPITLKRAMIVDLGKDYCRFPRQELLFSDTNHPTQTANAEVIAPALHAWQIRNAGAR